MGVEGFYGYLLRNRVEGAIIEHSVEEFMQIISSQESQSDKKPKILFNLRAVNNYFDQRSYDFVFGSRFNVVKNEFEEMLSSFKAAGADLIFVSKKSILDTSEDVQFNWCREEYNKGLELIEVMKERKPVKEIVRSINLRRFPWEETTIYVLIQLAENFGSFKPINCFMKTVPSHIKLANEEKVFAICGLNTSYLFHRGPWKLIFPVLSRRQKRMVFKEFDKNKILQHLQLNEDQFDLFGVLAGKLNSSLENINIMKSYFKNGNYADFNAIARFVRKFAPPEKFPLKEETANDILYEIFGSVNDKLKEDFLKSLLPNPPPDIPENSLDFDHEIKRFLEKNPFALFAESILYNIPFEIVSPFLDVQAGDMKTLMELTLGWIERFGGILLKEADENRTFPVNYRMRSGEMEKFEATPRFPLGIPDLKCLVNKAVTISEAYQTLSFLIGEELLTIEELKEIPLQHIMHVIIIMHLLKNNSMTMKEAVAMTKAVNIINAKVHYPDYVDARGFRVSCLYEKLFSVLLMILSPLGLDQFIGELKLDNVMFQKNLSSGSPNHMPPMNVAFQIIKGLLP